MQKRGIVNFDIRMLVADWLILLWAIRLIVHLVDRKCTKNEDRRYANLKLKVH